MKQCFFCSQGAKDIDYKDAELLKRFLSLQAKIIPSRISGVCAKHQRKLKKAIKQARYLGFLPYIP